MRNQIEGEIYKAVMNVGVNVDKEELLKALQYDRGQYQKGYKDRDDQIVRCKNCRWGDRARNGKGEEMILCYNGDTGIEDGYLHEPDWYCREGERKEGR